MHYIHFLNQNENISNTTIKDIIFQYKVNSRINVLINKSTKYYARDG